MVKEVEQVGMTKRGAIAIYGRPNQRILCIAPGLFILFMLILPRFLFIYLFWFFLRFLLFIYSFFYIILFSLRNDILTSKFWQLMDNSLSYSHYFYSHSPPLTLLFLLQKKMKRKK
jgi:hypothetical protein